MLLGIPAANLIIYIPVLCNILTKYNKFRGCATHFKHFGFSRSFMSKCKSQNIARKKRSDCITQNALETIHNFYSREDVSRTDPSQSSISTRTGKPKYFMQKRLKEAYTQLSTGLEVRETVRAMTRARKNTGTIGSEDQVQLSHRQCNIWFPC